ncbi:MAG: DUF4388 domain-containing protein [Acidobacteriota bacterium]
MAVESGLDPIRSARENMVGRVLQGFLSAIRIPDLLSFLCMLKKTGALTVDAAGFVKKIYLDSGEIIFASSSDPMENLGSFLVRRGKISEQQRAEAWSRVEPGKRQGRILVAMGLLTPNELWSTVQSQVLDIIYSIFPLNDGAFYFDETRDPHDEKITLAVSSGNIILEGVRRMDEWPRIRQMLPDDKAIPQRCPAEQRDHTIRLANGEQTIYELVDGERSVEEIVRQWRMEEFEALRALMTLVLARYVYVPDTKFVRQAVQEEDDYEVIANRVSLFNEISSMVVDCMKKRMTADSLGMHLRAVLESVSLPEIAGVELDASGRLDPNVILSNVAEYPADGRRLAVSNAMSTLLSALLLASDRHLDPAEKKTVLRVVEKLAKVP